MKKGTDKLNADRNLRSLFLLSVIALLLPIGFQTEASSREKALNGSRVANLKLELKIPVFVESVRALSLEGLATLGELGLAPGDHNPALLLGLRRAIFPARLKNWMNRLTLPNHMKGKLLDRFIMSGIYRIGFRVGVGTNLVSNWN